MRAIIIFSLAGTVTLSPAFAQQPKELPLAQPPVQKLDPKACSDRDRAKLGDSGDAQETQGSAGPKDSLSDKLARTDGVICPPPEIDPDMHQPAPGGGATPVIPPPGSPGGDPSVQPK
jgi:hypothetical protein